MRPTIPIRRTLVVGVDIGQKRDPTAIAVAEIDRREEQGRKVTHFVVRYLDRLPLGTPYPEVACRIAQVTEGARAQMEAPPRLYVYLDATGVGQPVADLVAERRIQGHVISVYFTHGDRRLSDLTKVSLGKAFLVSRLQTLLQSGRLHLPERDEARVLAQELETYEIKIDQDANDRYGAFRVGTHDDLVTALGLAVQVDNPQPLQPVQASGASWLPPGFY